MPHRKPSLLREVNERIREVSSQWETPGSAAFFCECPNASCSEVLDLTLADYEAIRALTDCYVVVRGHESCARDHVVAQNSSHVVVHLGPEPTSLPAT
jgi:hypothetical protein